MRSTCLLRRTYMSSFWKTPVGNKGLDLTFDGLWLSLSLPKDCVETFFFFGVKFSSFLTTLNNLFHTAPWCAWESGIKIHWIPFWMNHCSVHNSIFQWHLFILCHFQGRLPMPDPVLQRTANEHLQMNPYPKMRLLTDLCLIPQKGENNTTFPCWPW